MTDQNNASSGTGQSSPSGEGRRTQEIVSALKSLVNFAEMELACRRSSYMPDPGPYERSLILEAERVIEQGYAALSLAQSDLPVAPSTQMREEDQSEARAKGDGE